MDCIKLEYNGWCCIPAKNARFQYIGHRKDLPHIISGTEYIKLSIEQRADYAVENIIDTILKCSQNEFSDYEWTDIIVET